MSAPDPDLSHLVSLIAAAEAEAERLGAGALSVAGALKEAGAQARALQSHGGMPDEGVPVQELTTGNDQ